MNIKGIIPKNVDPIELADKIKGDLTGEFLKRINFIRSRRRLKSHLVR